MKKVLFSLCFTFFLITSVQSQCIAEAGSDRVACNGLNGIDTLMIGGNPSSASGTAPYTYRWEASYSFASFQFSASDFLDDTTLANPSILNSGPAELTFYLTVIDSLGNSCIDSTHIQFSYFGTTLSDNFRTINAGDSVQIFPNGGGGIPPISYQWTPTTDLSDPNIATPWASPDTTTFYVVTLTDSAGCQMTVPDVFEVYVNAVGLQEIVTAPKIAELNPNPLTDQSILTIDYPSASDLVIDFYDVKGRIIHRLNTAQKRIVLQKTDFKAGIYFYQIRDEQQVLQKGKLVVN